MIETIEKLFTGNQLGSTALILMLGGSVMGIVWKSWSYVTRFFNYLFFVQVSFTNSDQSFYAIQNWLFNQTYTKSYCSNLMVRNIDQKVRDDFDHDYGCGEDNKTQIFVPGYGTHYLFIKNRLATIVYSKADSKDLKNREFIDIKVFCPFNKFKFSQVLVEEANAFFNKEKYKETFIYSCVDRHSGYWQLLAKKNIKQHPILSYDTEYEELIDDIQKFIDNEQWYFDRGINYKRGFLFAGSPGSGKSSSILALAQRFKKHLYIVNLADMTMDDTKFTELISRIPADAIVSFEDIDAVTHDRKVETKSKNEQTISLSTVLNTLDGPFTPDRFIFIITSNHPEKLDPALVRPGRIDVTKSFADSNEYQCRTIFKRFLPDAPIEQENEFVANYVGKSMALLENELIKISK